MPAGPGRSVALPGLPDCDEVQDWSSAHLSVDEDKKKPRNIYILQNHKIKHTQGKRKNHRRLFYRHFIDSLDKFQIKYRKKTRKVDWTHGILGRNYLGL